MLYFDAFAVTLRASAIWTRIASFEPRPTPTFRGENGMQLDFLSPAPGTPELFALERLRLTIIRERQSGLVEFPIGI